MTNLATVYEQLEKEELSNGMALYALLQEGKGSWETQVCSKLLNISLQN